MQNRMIILSLGVLLATGGGAAAIYSGVLSPALASQPPMAAEQLVMIGQPANEAPLSFSSSMTNGPVIAVTGLDQQSSINSLDLEISNVRLGARKTQPSAQASVTGMKLAKVATADSFQFTRPTVSNHQFSVSGQFSMTDLTPTDRPEPLSLGSNTVVASIVDTAQTSAIEIEASANLPYAPIVLANLASFSSAHATDISVRLTVSEASYQRIASLSPLDHSPFGLSCTPEFSAQTAPDAMVQLALNVPCHPNTVVTIHHGRLKFARRTNHTGRLTLMVPALEVDAQFIAEIANGPTLTSETAVPNAKSVNRVAVYWAGPFDLDLNAFEFGAAEDAKGHVSAKTPRSVQYANLYGGGYMMSFGDADIENPMRAAVYTLPLTKDMTPGVVRLELMAKGTISACSVKAAIFTLRSAGGKTVAAKGMQIALPRCDAVSHRVRIKNALRDIHIAAR